MKKRKTTSSSGVYHSMEEINAKFFPSANRGRIIESFTTPEALGGNLALQALKKVKI